MRKALTLLVVLFVLLFVLASGVLIAPIQIGFYLTLGWIAFLKRTLSQATINWSGVALATICTALIFFGIHWFCSWLQRNAANLSPNARKAWSWRWSAGILICILLLFSTSVAITGIVHQVGWWIGSKEPLYVPGKRVERIVTINDMKQQALEIMIVAQENKWEWNATKKNLAHDPVLSRYSIEHWHRLFVANDKDDLIAVLIFPRDPNKQTKAGFCLVEKEDFEIYPIQKLPEELVRYGLRQRR